jgi:hypothetical protein
MNLTDKSIQYLNNIEKGNIYRIRFSLRKEFYYDVIFIETASAALIPSTAEETIPPA